MRAAVLVVVLGCAFSTSRVLADEPRLVIARAADLAPLEVAAATGLLSLGTALYLVDSGPRRSAWRGGILFDDDVRRALRASLAAERRAAMWSSDALLVATMALPFVIDGVVTPLERSVDPAAVGRSMLASASAFGATLLVGGIVKLLVPRDRPHAEWCSSLSRLSSCNSDASRGFFSAHAALTATSAGILCSRVERDGVASCIAAGTSALITGLLRLISDQHFSSDVIVGLALGFVAGWFVPLAFDHLAPRRSESTSAAMTYGGVSPWGG